MKNKLTSEQSRAKLQQRFKRTPAGVIPIDWSWAKGEAIFSPIKGKNPAELVSTPKTGYLPYLSSEYLRENKAVYARPNGNTAVAKDGDVLLLWDGSNAGEMFLAKSGIISSTMAELRINNPTLVEKSYVYFALKAKEQLLKRTTKGTGVPHVDGQLLNILPISLPPKTEQVRIAEVLSSIERVIVSLSQTIQQTQILKKSIMQQLFTVSIRGKRTTPIRDLLLFCQYGLNKPLQTSSAGVAVLRMNNLVDGKVDTRDLKYAKLTCEEEKEYLLKEGDILFNRTNSQDLVGKVSIFMGSGKIAFASYLLRLRVNPEKVNPSWLNFYLNSPIIQTALRALATPGVSQSNINAQAMQAIKLNVPDLKTQERAARLLESLEVRIKSESAKKSSLEQTKFGLMQVLLTGKVRVKP